MQEKHGCHSSSLQVQHVRCSTSSRRKLSSLVCHLPGSASRCFWKNLTTFAARSYAKGTIRKCHIGSTTVYASYTRRLMCQTSRHSQRQCERHRWLPRFAACEA